MDSQKRSQRPGKKAVGSPEVSQPLKNNNNKINKGCV